MERTLERLLERFKVKCAVLSSMFYQFNELRRQLTLCAASRCAFECMANLLLGLTGFGQRH